MKQTAVEWLLENAHIIPKNELNKREVIEQAKEMEKEQIIRAFTYAEYSIYINSGEEYYNETFNE